MPLRSADCAGETGPFEHLCVERVRKTQVVSVAAHHHLNRKGLHRKEPDDGDPGLTISLVRSHESGLVDGLLMIPPVAHLEGER